MKANSLVMITLGLGLTFSTISCQKEKVDTTKEAERLMQASRDWSALAASRDIEKTLAYWTDDAIVLSCDQGPLKGKEAIRQMVEGSMSDPGFSISWEPISAEVSESGDMGYLLEKTKMTMSDSTGTATVMHFNSVTIWKKQTDGSWKNVVDVISANE